jgi:hypothetical protein
MRFALLRMTIVVKEEFCRAPSAIALIYPGSTRFGERELE